MLISPNPVNPEQAAPKILANNTKLVAALGDISSDTLRLPNSVGSLQGLKKRGEIAVASGGTTDIWRGTWNTQQVAFKAFRIYPPQDLQEAKKILWKVVPTWKRLVHENVLPFHGIDTSTFQLALVYDWGHNGNITQYLESNPSASRPELVRIRLRFARNASSNRFHKLLQIARGLQYLHSFGIVHGDLKGVRELATSQTPAKLTDVSLGQCADIQGQDSPGLRLRPDLHHLEPDVHSRSDSRSCRILSVASPRDH
jgi:serine/threonine protein kinase